MGRRLLAVLAAAVGLVVAAPVAAFACGGLIAPGHAEVLQEATTLVAWHGGLEHYITGFEFSEVDGGVKIHHFEEIEMAFGPIGSLIEAGFGWWLRDSVPQEVKEIKRLMEAGERGKGI